MEIDFPHIGRDASDAQFECLNPLRWKVRLDMQCIEPPTIWLQLLPPPFIRQRQLPKISYKFESTWVLSEEVLHIFWLPEHFPWSWVVIGTAESPVVRHNSCWGINCLKLLIALTTNLIPSHLFQHLFLFLRLWYIMRWSLPRESCASSCHSLCGCFVSCLVL